MVPAYGQTWTGAVDNTWFNAGNWSPGTIPNSNIANAVIGIATNNPVLLDQVASVSTLQLATGTSLNVTGSNLEVFGTSIANNGAVSISNFLELANNVTLSGSGALTMAGVQFGTDSNGYTLTNQSTINGYGQIGSGAGGLRESFPE